jgi:hypothetical protein
MTDFHETFVFPFFRISGGFRGFARKKTIIFGISALFPTFCRNKKNLFSEVAVESKKLLDSPIRIPVMYIRGFSVVVDYLAMNLRMNDLSVYVRNNYYVFTSSTVMCVKK